jgi:hypothetical protein
MAESISEGTLKQWVKRKLYIMDLGIFSDLLS